MKTKDEKDVLIRKFMTINFGLVLLFGLLLYIGKTRGVELGPFATLQMYFPAMAAIITVMSSGVDLEKTTKRTYYIYIAMTVVLMINVVLTLILPRYDFTNTILMIGSIVFLISMFREKLEKRTVANLRKGGLKKGGPVVLLFLALYIFRPYVISLISGESIAGILTLQNGIFVVALFINFVFTFLPFLGEEYGWRYFLQPLLQNKYGEKLGLIILGVVWGLWHLPLNLFFYSAEGSQLISLFNQIFLCISYSIFFGYAYNKTGSIWVVTLIHYLNNNLILLFTEDLDPSIIENQELNWPGVLVSVVIGLLIYGPFLLSKYIKKPQPDPVERFEENIE